MAFVNFQKWCFSCLKSKEGYNAAMRRVAKQDSDPYVTREVTYTGEEKEKMSATEEPLRSASCGGNILLAAAAGDQRPNVEYTFNWAKKYQPKVLKDFICHREKAATLQSMVRSSGQLNHCIFEGPPGVGKRTMALAMLRECIGLEVTETREELREFNLSGSKQVPISTIDAKIEVSSQVIQIDLSAIKWHATDLLLGLLEETHKNGQAIIVNAAERLSKDAQLQIKSFLETCRGQHKVIFCCYDISRLPNLSPLCTVIQLLPPVNEEIVEVLNFIAKQQGVELPDRLANNIAEKSQRCLQQAIRSFEATWHSNYPFKEDQLIMTGWEEELANIARSIIEEQSPKRLFIFRQKLQTLLEHNLCPHFVYGTLVEELKRHLDDQVQLPIRIICPKYSAENQDFIFERNRMGNQDKAFCEQIRAARFVMIEEFAAKFMSFYKDYGIKQD